MNLDWILREPVQTSDDDVQPLAVLLSKYKAIFQGMVAARVDKQMLSV